MASRLAQEGFLRPEASERARPGRTGIGCILNRPAVAKGWLPPAALRVGTRPSPPRLSRCAIYRLKLPVRLVQKHEREPGTARRCKR